MKKTIFTLITVALIACNTENKQLTSLDNELDKVSSTPRGEEIINLLIHLTDFSQNDHFMDKYYSDIPLDLSKTLFIFSLSPELIISSYNFK